jgi:hypothetical protein
MAELLQTRIANGSGTARDGNRASRHDAKSSGQPEDNGGATAARAPHSSWPRQNTDWTRACEPKRRAHPGRHDSRGSQAPSAPKRP